MISVLLWLLIEAVAGQYCVSGPTTVVDGNLGKVLLEGNGGAIDDSTDCQGKTTGPKDLTSLNVNLSPGSTYTLNYNVTTCGNVFPTVSGAWIDYDQNGTFDKTESLFTFVRTSTGGYQSRTFTVSATTPVKDGRTRMRVQVQETSSQNDLDPCARFAYGGTKDYSVTIGGSSSDSESSGMGGGWIFIIIVIVASFVYIVVGCLYNRQKKGTTGMRESCPQNEFWCDIPQLVKEGFLFTKAKLTGQSTGGDSYGKIGGGGSENDL